LKHPREKGRRLELKIAKMIRRKGLDDKASRMPMSGAFPHLQADIYTSLPLHIEVKNQEKVRLWEWWETTRSKARPPKEPCLVISGNFRPIVAVVRFEYLLDLLRAEKESLENGDSV